MVRRYLIIVVALFLVGCERNEESGGIQWQKDYQAGMQQAKQENKAVLLFFTASWCPPCQQMKKTTFKDDAVKTFVESKFIPLYLDSDKEEALSSQYGVQFLPTYYVLKPDGTVVESFSGYFEAEDFLGELKKRLKDF